MVLAAMVEERKRAEKKLRESEEKFRSVFSDASVGMAIVSLDGHFLAGDQEFCQFIGYSEQELLGKTVQSVTHPRLADVLGEISLCPNGRSRIPASGETLPAQERPSIVRDGPAALP